MGLFGKNKKSVNATLNALSKTFLNSVVEVKNSCHASSSASNIVNVTAQGTADNAKAVLDCMAVAGKFGFDPSKCSSFVATNKIGSIKQSIKVNLTSDCKLDSTDVKNLQANMENALTQKNDQVNDGVATALNDLVNVLGGSDSSKTYSQSVHDMVQRSFTTDVVNETITNLTGSNILSIAAIGLAYQEVGGVEMSIESTAMVSAMTKNKTIADTLDTFKQKVDQDNNEQTKGLTDIIDSVGATVGGIFKTMSWVWIAVVCVGGVIVLWGLWVGLRFLLSPAGQDGAREIAKAGADKIRDTPIIPV
jgi:hypothetical protein